MKKLLWVGDAACPSGFARATHGVLETLRTRYDITVLGINYRGDPHSYPYPIFTAMAGGDFMGVGRLVWMCDYVKPDVIVIQNDPWNFEGYVRQLRQFKEFNHVKMIGAVAVDGKNCMGRGLNGLDYAVFWTQFGLDEAREGGFVKPGEVIPLGLDTVAFHPMDRYEARYRKGLPQTFDDAFIVGSVNRNQPRKRWDLTVRYFAQWIKREKIEDAWLFLHTAPTGDMGVNVKLLAQYYGVLDRLMLAEPAVFYGIPEEELCETYNCFDIQISTTQGEGFGLTHLEGMACGIPQIVPDWAALGELLKGAAWLVPCTSTAVGPPYVNVIGGVADEEKFIQALSRMYHDRSAREQNSQAALERAQHPRYRWENVGKAWLEVVEKTLAQVEVEA